MKAGHRRKATAVIACLAVSGAVMTVQVARARAAVAGAPAANATAANAPAANAWVRNTKSVPALPRGSRALRPLSPATMLHAELVLAPRDPGALEAFASAVSTPGSPSFRHYLAPGQFAGVFGARPATISAVRQWLADRGLTLGPTSADGLVVPVSGTATQVDHAFSVGLEQYRLPSGRVVHAPDAEPLVPRALAGAIDGVAGLDDLSRPTPQLARSSAGTAGATARTVATPRAAGAAGAPAPFAAGAAVAHANGPTPTAGCVNTIQAIQANSGALTVDELAQAYSFASLYPGNEGSGVTVGVYELEPYLQSDINAFKSCYGSAIGATVSPVSVDGASPNGGAGQGEAALDIEMVIGMAPSVNVRVYVGPNGGTGPLDTYLRMVNGGGLPRVISTSWGQCEAQLPAVEIQAEASIFQQAAAQGQTVIAASGDEGSEDCYLFPSSNDTRLQVDDPAGQPWVTGVGGTTIDTFGPPPTETAWNSGLFSGTGGGGASTNWTMPSWQRGPGVQSPYTKPQNNFTGLQPCPTSSGPGTVSCREVPDVASDGDPHTGLAVFCSCFAGGWAKIGGTSMSSPLWGALTALADQGQPSPVGFLNPVLYQAGCEANPPFNDITVGDNQPQGSVPSNIPHVPSGPFYPATPGYDQATGLGTPVADALVGQLRSPPPGTCPVVTGISTSSGPASGGTVVQVSGSNLGGVSEVDFGSGNPGVIDAVTPTAVTVSAPVSPTRGWAVSDVLVRAGSDVLGFDGSTPFTYLGPRGYWTVASDGGIFSFGQMAYYGSMGGRPLTRPVVGMASTPSSKGYWLVASDGGIFSFGDAGFHGSTGNLRLTQPVVGMASTPDGGGYWLVASDGGIFSFGDAGFHGSMGATKLAQPVVGMASTPDGGGYWLVAADGGIFAFGDAGFHGSTGNLRLTRPVVGMAATPDGGGYWLVAADGGIFAFDGRYGGFFGSAGNIRLTKPMVGIGAP